MFQELTNTYVNRAVETETENAIKNYGPTYASLHEAYAVLKEEVEEAGTEQDGIEHKLEWVWNSIRKNQKPVAFSHLVEAIRTDAINMAKEACQIAAVCEKFQRTIQEHKNE